MKGDDIGTVESDETVTVVMPRLLAMDLLDACDRSPHTTGQALGSKARDGLAESIRAALTGTSPGPYAAPVIPPTLAVVEPGKGKLMELPGEVVSAIVDRFSKYDTAHDGLVNALTALRSEFREAMAAQVAGRHWTKEDERDRGQTFARIVGQVWELATTWPHFVPKR
jgi:hypothetical protein